MKKTSVLLFIALMIGFSGLVEAKPKWISLFNGKDLNGWFARGKARWYVKDGELVGERVHGHGNAGVQGESVRQIAGDDGLQGAAGAVIDDAGTERRVRTGELEGTGGNERAGVVGIVAAVVG